MNDQTSQGGLFDQLGGVFTGDKNLGIEVKVAEKDMQKLAVYILIAMLIGVFLGNLMSKLITR